ncbi:MAG TPA: glycosyltransferase family 39 protein, partial [Tepidisphaeraceae bacterium]|nr:glycosyltransferase family 39 protein [Tepidisphaeraceae bacterium]
GSTRVPIWMDGMSLLLAIALAAGYLTFILQYWAPAHAGNNQNGYLVAGKLMATTGWPGFEPSSPFSFVGWMWGMADASSAAPGGGMHYTKYPLGYPMLIAAAYALAPEGRAYDWAHLVNPIAMALAVLGAFVLGRQIMHPLAALLGAVLVAANPVLMTLANNPNSHATGVCFVVWGVAMTLVFAQHGWLWAGLLGGFLLGYACTIRYTEGLMGLCIGLAVLMQLRLRGRDELTSRPLLGIATVLAVGVVMLAASGVVARMYSRGWGVGAGTIALALLVGFIYLTRRSPIYRERRWPLASETLRVISMLALLIVGGGAIALGYLSSTETPSLSGSIDFILARWLLSGSVIVAAIIGATILFGTRWLRVSLPLAAWALPIVMLVLFNKYAMNDWTGYDSTAESTGFAFEHLKNKWQFAVRELYATGAYFLLPIGMLGLLMMLQSRWRAGLILLAWLVPGAAVYMAYYWGRGLPLWGFLRFYATLLPIFGIASAWVVAQVIISQRLTAPGWRTAIGALGAAIVMAFVVWTNYDAAVPALERDHTVASNIHYSASRARELAPAGSVVFGHSQRLLNHMQFSTEFDLYGGDWLLGEFPVPRIRTDNQSEANPIQPARRAFLGAAIGPLDSDARRAIVRQIVNDAHAAGRPAYVFLPPNRAMQFVTRYCQGFETVEVDKWTEPHNFSAASRDALGAGSTGLQNPAPTMYSLIRIDPENPGER